MKEIRIDCPSHSHFPKERLSCISIQNIGIFLKPSLVRGPIVQDTWINDRHPAILLKELLHFIQRKASQVDCKDFAVDHVVQVIPDSIEREIVLLELGDDCLKVGDVVVPPTTLVIPKGPERWESSFVVRGIVVELGQHLIGFI